LDAVTVRLIHPQSALQNHPENEPQTASPPSNRDQFFITPWNNNLLRETK
jgi:hypothetical protein